MTRRNRLWINNATGLSQVKQDLRDLLKQEKTLAVDVLEKVADQIYAEAISEVPRETDLLGDSIEVTVSKSPRYPGIIVTATAVDPYNKVAYNSNYDYARIQEENEDYKHDPGQKAHYLRDPFRRGVEKFMKEMNYDK